MHFWVFWPGWSCCGQRGLWAFKHNVQTYAIRLWWKTDHESYAPSTWRSCEFLLEHLVSLPCICWYCEMLSCIGSAVLGLFCASFPRWKQAPAQCFHVRYTRVSHGGTHQYCSCRCGKKRTRDVHKCPVAQDGDWYKHTFASLQWPIFGFFHQRLESFDILAWLMNSGSWHPETAKTWLMKKVD